MVVAPPGDPLVFRSMPPRSPAKGSTPTLTQTPYLEIHGPWLRQLRKRAELEVDELAEQAGISSPYLKKLELGFSPRTSVRVYRALRAALGLSREEGVYILGNPWRSSEADESAPDNGDAA